jgi:NSS family neurotransmitter:Na+ symporter
MDTKQGSEKTFGSRFGYIMVAAGAAIGLGNIWKFPYIAYRDGGGTFLIIYIIVCFFLGQPGVLAETAVGRYSRANAVDAYGNINHRWKFLGVINLLATTMIDFYYMIVSGYIVKYFIAYLRGGHFGADKQAYYNAFISDPVQPLVYGAIVILITGFILAAGITEKVEKVCKVILPALLVLLVICSIWAISMSKNAELGLKFYLVPDLDGLNATTFADACMQVLFSVGIGWAIFITLGASVGDDHDLRSDSTWVVICDTLIAVLAGFVIIPAVVGDGSQMESGPSLIFIAMTTIFEKLPGGVIMGMFFFMAIMFAVFSTAFTIIEIPVKAVQEKAHISHTSATIITCVVVFIGGIFCSLSQGDGLLSGIGLPWYDFSQGLVYYNIYDWVDTFSGYVLLPLGTLLNAIFVSRVWGWDNLNAEVIKGCNKPVSKWDKFTIGFTVPLLALIVILHALGIDTLILG